jgi:hypothetical protein
VFAYSPPSTSCTFAYRMDGGFVLIERHVFAGVCLVGARSDRYKRLVHARSRTRWTSTGLAEARGTACNARREVEDIDRSK